MASKEISLEESLKKLYALKKLQEKELNVKGAIITDKIIKSFEKRRQENASNSERGSGRPKR